MARRAAALLALVLAAAVRPAPAQLRLAQVPIGSRAGVDSLARLGFEIADVRRLADGTLHAVIVVDPRTELPLLAGGYLPAVVALAPGAAAAAADTYHVYRSFDKPGVGIRATLEAWAAAGPGLALDSIGASLEGRPILAMKIGPGSDSPDRPNVLFLGTHHAREWVATEMAMKLIRWLADSLPPTLRDARDLWVVPVQNPDGYQFTFSDDRLWRKNRRPNPDGTRGVDPNRNYPAFWGFDDRGSSPDPSTETYRGAGPASEPETQAIIAFHAAHPPVVAVSYHTYSGLVLYPYGFRTGELAPDLPVFRALAGTDLLPAVRDGVPGSNITYYHPGPGWHLYPTNGEYTEWAYRAHGTIGFTPELTSGCCVAGASPYYGFAFPDDSALVDRVFQDNLPFALSAIAAAGDVANALGASGLRPGVARIESVWPEAWVSLDRAAPTPAGLTLSTSTGQLVARSTRSDSLWRGTVRSWWWTDLGADTLRAVRVDGAGLAAELLWLAGAEDTDVGWRGWRRDSTQRAGGRWSWMASGTDTLLSPVVNLAGRGRLWLQLWTKHSGSTFAPAQRGVVQFSTDSGTTWLDLGVIVGDGGSWYPLRLDLPDGAGTRGARLRFVAGGFPWWVDAVGLASDSTPLFEPLVVAGGAEVSENPVRGSQVVIAWPAGTSNARVGIYSFAGQRLVGATVPPPTNEYVWDLTIGGGRRVSNGAYLVVVDVDGQRYRRRLFVARSGSAP